MLTEQELFENFEDIRREVSKWVTDYEVAFPETNDQPYTGDWVVRQPIYAYEVHAT